MNTWMIDHEDAIRAAAFAVMLGLLLAVQHARPLRNDGHIGRRSFANLGFGLANALLLKFAVPASAVGWAIITAERHGGILGMIDASPAVELPLAVLLLDAGIYWQHRLLHRIPVLWRIHRMHHSDTRFDVTTGVRFHPLEILLSLAVKLGLVSLIGPSPVAVIFFEMLLSLGALFTHADFAFAPAVDRLLRILVVTPSMHRIHHSALRIETDSNYGFHLSIWDRLFGSYRAEPSTPERNLRIGLEHFREARDQRVPALLLQPFRAALVPPGGSHA